jgi:protein TonB
VEGGFGDGSGDGLLGGDGRVEPAGPPAPVAVAPDMVPPALVRRVQPAYPAIAIAARLPGFVVLQAVIGEDGSVEDVTVLRASNPIFVRSAVDAVRQWKYRAALQSGRPVRVYFTVRVEFQLK